MTKKNDVRLKLAIDAVQQEFTRQAELTALQHAAFAKREARYKRQRDQLLGSKVLKLIKAAQARDERASVSTIASRRSCDERLLKRATLMQLYCECGVDVEALARLDAEFDHELAIMAAFVPDIVPMQCSVAHIGAADPDDEAVLKNLRGKPLRVFGITPHSYHPPYSGKATSEEMALANPAVLGAHNDASDAAMGRISANVLMAHLHGFSSNGDNYAYARNTGLFVGAIDLPEPSFIRITARVLCQTSQQKVITEHTPWWDPRDSDSQTYMRDGLFFGIRRNVSGIPTTVVAAGELAHVQINEDDDFDDRLTRSPGELLTFTAIIPRLVTTTEDGECPFVFVGIRHYAFIWAKHIKFQLHAFCSWSLVDVFVDSI